MIVKALRSFISPIYGTVDTGDMVNIDADDAWRATAWAEEGLIEIVAEKAREKSRPSRDK